MAEFGATGCVPCDMMQPILNTLRKEFPEKLNVVFVHQDDVTRQLTKMGVAK